MKNIREIFDRVKACSNCYMYLFYIDIDKWYDEEICGMCGKDLTIIRKYIDDFEVHRAIDKKLKAEQ